MRSFDDGVGGALVDACSALDALGCVNDCDVIDGDGVLRANVCACAATDTLICINCRHDFFLVPNNCDEGIYKQR